MSYRPALLHSTALSCILFAVILVPCRAFAQQPDTAARDSAHRLAFPATASTLATPAPRRTIDLALTGGVGYYAQGITAALQPTANADFFARSPALDFMAGFHWGFSEPATKALA